MMKKGTVLFLSCFLLFFFCAIKNQEVLAAENMNKTLLLYDSRNDETGNSEHIDTLQRVLTSLGQAVTTVSEANYQKGVLTNESFGSVITLINWPEKGINNQHFLEDRKLFTGKKLHIGENLETDEAADFSGEFLSLYQQQVTLIANDDYYQEKLPLQPKVTVLQTTQGKIVGQLVVQAVEPKSFPFGVVQGESAYLPFFSEDGAIFLQSVTTIKEWLGREQTYHPILTLDQFTPLIDLDLAHWFVREIEKTNDAYILSTTGAVENIQSDSYKKFLTFLSEVQERNRLFLRMPYLNNETIEDTSELRNLIAKQISLLVDQNIFPVGLTTNDFWNQSEMFSDNALASGESLLLANNESATTFTPPKVEVSATYDMAIFQWQEKRGASIEWLKDADHYPFPLPLAIAYDFPRSKEEGKKILKSLNELPFRFPDFQDTTYTYGIKTATQHIQVRNAKIFLNGNQISRLSVQQETKQQSTKSDGLLNHLFAWLNRLLIIIVVATIIILILLFARGRKNYRAKYIRKDHEK
ncbi:hypothetical protein IGJ66_001108 [Enterococcus sp. DIV0176]|uniref:hypothetical protein n=1 Tax=Enterococcus sp. DIV0176 TaxID=2774758 RepID=UPI003D2FC742